MRDLLLLGLAGACGALARYWLSGIVQHICGANFAWGTFAVNALGCLLFGLIWTLADERELIDLRLRIVILTGFMGAFTTFSTFAFETVQYLNNSQWLLAAGNLLGQNFLGITCVFLGMAVGRLL